MDNEIVFHRYEAKEVVIGFVLIAAAIPVADQAREFFDERAPASHHQVTQDHLPEGPLPTRVAVSPASVAGTANATTTYLFTPVASAELPYRELKW